MPRYFFHVRDGTDLPDEEGTELLDLHEARIEAVKLAGVLLKDKPQVFWDGSTWHLEVADESATVLFRLDFKATEFVTANAPNAKTPPAEADGATPWGPVSAQ